MASSGDRSRSKADPGANWHTESIWLSGDDHLDVLESPASDEPPLMFIHGWGLSARSYLPALTQMTPWARVYAPTLPGFGTSSPLPRRGRHDLPAYAAAVLATWRDGQLPQPMPIVAHSMGCGVAVKLARARPDLVTSLVLVCPIGGAGKHPVSWLRLAGSLAREAHVGFLPRLLDSGPSMVRNAGDAVHAGYVAKTADLHGDIRALVNSGRPITIIAASDDGVVPPGPLRSSGATFLEVPGGHGWLLRRPAEFARVVKPFVFPPPWREHIVHDPEPA